LFRASAETLQELARNPHHLGADIGFLSVLHTWGKIYWLILTSTASFPPVASRPTAPTGSILATPSSCPSTYSVASSAASSSPA
jgi:hypothetical protein